ncbi:MAG TPA: hypothetical protein VMG63_24005 [Terriglobia bacterium]|nr:hypothetical protein [Terriglobia bacterium]
MPSPEKDQLAAEAMECWVDFQQGLSSDKRKYPIQQFKAFWAVTKRYAELTKSNPLIHRRVAEAVNGLTDFLEVERKRVPDLVLRDADAWSASCLADTTRISRGMNPRDCKCGPTTQRPYYLGGSDDPFTEVVRASDSGQEQPWYPIN